jgi:squalene-hopene/tetraprenyl-beta-curcumene cyclase
VVSYALPALIAIGQAKFHHDPTRNPLVRLVRRATVGRTLRVLQDIQPTGGGFLEAAPLTSFVVMSLAAAGRKDHPVAARGVNFLVRSVRPDGSWPIDTNLATWVTTLAVNALAAGGDLASALDEGARRSILDWLLAQQAVVEHPYTHAAPGGWAWTDLSGGVLDADDTAGAMIAIRNLSWAGVDERTRSAAAAGVKWLVDLQNRDGGIPTFCRGWGTLPFDRGSPDLTAHALAAWSCWLDELPVPLRARTEAAMRKAVAYLGITQRPEGAWSALWFGNQDAPDEENLTYGTARVLPALGELSRRPGAAAGAPIHEMLIGGVRWLLSAQNEDGGWGGAPGVAASIEETALAVDALAEVLPCGEPPAADQLLQVQVSSAVSRGVAWLVRNTGSGEAMNPSPIGFYFAKLWYFERMYPLVFAVSALGRVKRLRH